MTNFISYCESRDLETYATKYKVNPDQLKKGIAVEKEHDGSMGKDTDVVNSYEDYVKIAVAHIREDPKYYDKLAKIEDH